MSVPDRPPAACRGWTVCAHLVVVCVAVGGCSRSKDATRDAGWLTTANEADAFDWPLAPAPSGEAPRKGMVYVPAGTLLSGTPKDKTPRLVDREPDGQPVVLRGFFIDEYAYPNEAGAIPKTGMNRDEAGALCAAQGKRLCTELEWERACKGPSNTTYEYGEQYRAGECGTGSAPRPSPSGLRVTCKSAFGVHDMHGGAWEWTASTWRRGNEPQSGVARGGSSDVGELSARCANALPLPVKLRRPDVGTRCCAGEINEAEIKLAVTRGKALEAHPRDPALTAALSRIVHDRAPVDAGAEQPFQAERVYLWHPVGNEELVLASGCVKKSPRSTCGVGVFRVRSDDADPNFLGFAPSGMWLAAVKTERGHDLWVYGGDGRVNFRRRVAYVWGRVAVGDPERVLSRV